MSEIEKKLVKRFMYTTVPWVVVKLMVYMEERRAKRKKVQVVLLSYRNFLMMLSLVFVALNALPIFSAHCGGSESCTLMVRGYNLLEFSFWAVLPVFTVVIILGILFSFQKKSAKNVELLLLLLANVVCCLESMKAARTWLEGISNAPVNSHFGMVAFPLGIMAIIFYAILYVNNFKNFSNSTR